MRISARAEYACLAVIELARSPSDARVPKRVREIAEAQGIPERYLVQILLQLKAASLVQSERGAVGGYLLSRPADRITIADVLMAIEGPGDLPRRAASPAAERLSALLEQARDAERGVLAGATIAQLAMSDSSLDWTL